MTITSIQQRIQARYPRIDAEVTSEITSDIYNWIRDICSEYPFWFLRVHPGITFPTNFPTDAATVTGLTHIQTNWLDRGWLHVIKGQERYYLAAPVATGQFDVDPANWARVEAQKIYFVKQFDMLGNFQNDLPVHMGSREMSKAYWGFQGSPREVLFESGLDSTGQQCSWLRFNPIPDQDYLYAISFCLAQPINYGSPITNRFFQEYPEAAITAGLLFCAEYFQEERDIKYYTQKLVGDPSGGFTTRRNSYIEKMKRDTRRMSEQEDYTIPVFLGARGAVGRGGRQPDVRWRGLYYGRDGFS